MNDEDYNALLTNLKMYHLMIQYLKENVDQEVFERSKEYADDYYGRVASIRREMKRVFPS